MTITQTDHPAAQADPEAQAIRAENLVVTYGDFAAVKGITFHVNTGEFYALLGTNGAGKTTTLETLEGQRKASSGVAHLFGQNSYTHRAKLAGRLGIMLQSAGLAEDLTVAETARMWLELNSAGLSGAAVRSRVTEALAGLELSDKADARVRKLSGGQRRRLDLVMATINEPDLLFLDEPTTGLDPESRDRTWAHIKKMHDGGTTVILTTHYLEEAESMADRLAIMHEGRIALEGSLTEVLSSQPANISFAVRGELVDGVLGGLESRGSAVLTPRGDVTHVALRPADLQGELYRLLSSADAMGARLENVRASEASLAEVFRRISQTSGDTAQQD